MNDFPAATASLPAPELKAPDLEKLEAKATSFGRGSAAAMMQSSQIWAAGLQELSNSLAAAASLQFKHSTSSWKALSGAKSLREAIDLQTEFARTSFDQAMTETSKFTNASMELARKATAPLTAQWSQSVTRATPPAF